MTLDFEVDPRDQRWQVDRPTYRVALWSVNGDALVVWWHELHGPDVDEVLAWTAEHAQGRTSVVYVVHSDRDGLGLFRVAGTDPSASGAAPAVFHQARPWMSWW